MYLCEKIPYQVFENKSSLTRVSVVHLFLNKPSCFFIMKGLKITRVFEPDFNSNEKKPLKNSQAFRVLLNLFRTNAQNKV
jgi:hypothetical protein